MQANVKHIAGNWDAGLALDKHVLSSTFTGHNEYGHPQFHTTRSEIGEALFKLKYRNDWTQITPLATQLATSAFPNFPNTSLILPMPPSTARARQPVYELAQALGQITGVPVFNNLLIKTAKHPPLKDLGSKQEKVDALKAVFQVNDILPENGLHNALIIDDLFDTGASLEAACTSLRNYSKIGMIYVATLTWK